MEPSKELKQAVIDYKNGREEAFTTLYEESQRYIYVCISKIMKGCNNLPDVVSDLMQDTYVEISRHISQLENVESFLNWAGTIATRQCYAYLKKNNQYALLFEEDGTLDELVADEDLIPETLMQDREKQRLVRKIIDTELTPIQRLCVIAYYYNEQKQSEIARDLGIPENTVKTHLSRAKVKIRESVLDLEKKEGTKLYSTAPFLLLLLGEEIRECVVPAQITKMILSAGNAGTMSAVGVGAKAAAAAGKGGAIAAGKGGAAAAGKGGVAAALKIKIAAAVIGVGTIAAVGGGILLSQNSQPETPDEIQEEYVEGKKEEVFMGYQFQYPESVELELNGDGYYFRYHTDIAALVQVPVDSFLFSKNITDLKEAPAASEKYVFEKLETSVSELFDPDATTQTITSSEVMTINGIKMLRVEGIFTNTQKERDVQFVGYYFFTEITPAFQTFSTPFYVIGIPLNDEADAASFIDEFAEGITRTSEK
ncbi:MAG: RNA polymerase sigma factor [Acetatifactor sp.]|nr:RNA polymerase sigma factor [Acetatifactor sp.]